MTSCRNPECRNGYTPGVLASGKGTPNAPVVGATMRWGWVNCRACKPKDKDPTYQHVPRMPAEIQERARLADAKAPYVNQAPPNRSKLESIAAHAPPPAQATAGISPDRFDKLLGQIEKLTDQVSSLLEENKSLRQKLESAAPAVARPRKKRGDPDVKLS